jgi:predicted peptidase
MKALLLLFLAVLLCPRPTIAQSSATGFLDRSVTHEGRVYDYQVYVPRDYTPEEDWPVILFLHGAGERGSDGIIPTEVGLGRAIRRNVSRWPAIVVFPQVPLSRSWGDEPAAAGMIALEAAIDEFSIDEDRQYLTGLSMGGFGTWYLGYHHPDRWAAMVAICSFVKGPASYPDYLPSEDPEHVLARKIDHIPIWIFHGDADSVVPVESARRLNSALQEENAEVYYTEYPGVGHNSWDAAYDTGDMIEWLFSKHRE